MTKRFDMKTGFVIRCGLSVRGGRGAERLQHDPDLRAAGRAGGRHVPRANQPAPRPSRRRVPRPAMIAWQDFFLDPKPAAADRASR